MDEKYLVVRFSDGTDWRIPASIIARSRAHYYAARDLEKDGIDYDETYNSEFSFTLGNDFELLDWAAGNMDWSDIAEYAERLSGMEPSNKEAEWSNAQKEIQ